MTLLLTRRRVAHILPNGVRNFAIGLYNWLAQYSPARRAAARWVTDVYTGHILETRKRVFLTIANFAQVNRPIHGYYLEFGCCGARTMRLAWDSFHHLFDWNYIGFDSFEGFPEIHAIDNLEIFKRGGAAFDQGEFHRTCAAHGIPADRLKTVKGFFDVSLNAECKALLNGKKAAVIYIDCDLYESTVPVLRFCRDFLQRGTVIVFDEWNCFHADPDKGERLAWREFCEQNPDIRFSQIIDNGLQAAFSCVSAPVV